MRTFIHQSLLAAFAGTSLVASAAAAPRESTTFPATINSASSVAGPNQPPASGVVLLNQTFTGGYTAVRINLTGTLTSAFAGTWREDSRIFVTPPGGASFTIQPFTGTTFTSLPIPAGFGVNLGAGYNPAGSWSYRFFEDYQDAAGGVTDATWDNLVLTFDDALPPPPPPPTADVDWGTLVANGVALTDTATLTGSTIRWFRFVIPAAGVVAVNGTYLDIDTENSARADATVYDTYMTLFNQDGTVRSQDDDDGSGFHSQFSFGIGTRPAQSTNGGAAGATYDGRDGNLIAGTYFLAVYGYPNGTGSPAAPFTVSSTSAQDGTLVVNAVYGQQAPPAPPTVFQNMGTLVADGAFATRTIGLDPATVKWVKFTLPGPIDAAASTYLDIDTETSTVAATAICLFRQDGSIAAQDTVDGSGTLSLLTFGAGTRLPAGDGTLYNGRDGTSLPAGDYYMAVALPAATFTTGWFASSTSADTGDVVVRVRTGTQPPPTPPATFTDLGTLAVGVRTETTPLGAGEVKWFRFVLAADASVANNTFLDIDTENSVLTGGGGDDTYITLFSSTGAVRAQDDLDGSGFHSQLTFGQTTPARPAVSSNGAAIGQPYNGRDGDLVAGTWWLAAYGYPNAAGSPAAGWIVASTSPQTGTLVVNLAYGSPIPPAPPASFTDLGALPNDGNFISQTTNVTTVRQVKWFRFTLSSPVARSARDYLDMDTETSTVAATAMGMYEAATGVLVISDTADGSGTLSQISFGAGTRAAPGDGLAYNGRDGATVAAGDYYVAVTSAPASFASGWSAASSNTDTGGTLVFNIRRGVQPPAPPPAGFVDIGRLRGDKVIDTEDGMPIAMNGSQIRWYKFNLPADASDATTRYVDIDTDGSVQTDGVTILDTEIGLFNSGGSMLVNNDDGAPGFLSLMTFGATTPVRPAGTAGPDDFARDGRNGPLTAGDYYLAVGLFNTTFADDFTVASTSALTGTLIVTIYNNYPTGPVPCNAADVAGLGGTAGADHQLTADDIIVYLDAFFSNNLAIADIAVLGGTPGHDGLLTADDLIYFLDQFFRPCI